MKNKFLSGFFLVSSLAMGVNAKDYKTDIHIAISSSDIGSENKTAYNMGYGISKTFDNKIFTAVSFDVEYASPQRGSLYGYGVDFKLGYNFWNKLNIYSIVAGKGQSTNGDAAYGFGYGAGVEYPVTQSVGIAVEYKNYNMVSSNIPDDEYEILGLNLKYPNC